MKPEVLGATIGEDNHIEYHDKNQESDFYTIYIEGSDYPYNGEFSTVEIAEQFITENIDENNNIITNNTTR